MGIIHKSGGFSPHRVSGCVAWFEADRGLTLVENSGVWYLAGWANQMRTGINAGQTDPAQRPQYLENQINGHPAIVMNGSNRLELSSAIALNDLTFVVVATKTAQTSTKCIVIFGDSGTYFAIRPTVGVPNFRQYVSGSDYYANHSPNADALSPHIYGATRSSGVMTARKDGASTTGDTRVATFTLKDLFYYPPTTFSFDGKAALILIYLRCLLDSELRYIENGIGQKYGITVS